MYRSHHKPYEEIVGLDVLFTLAFLRKEEVAL